MSDNLEKACLLLGKSGATCVLKSENDEIVCFERGIMPLMRLARRCKDFSEYCAADRVVGKAAAFVYVVLGIKELFAGVVSKTAMEVFAQNGIDVYCSCEVPRILNRSGDGYCPMEEAVLDEVDPKRAMDVLKEKIENM